MLTKGVMFFLNFKINVLVDMIIFLI